MPTEPIPPRNGPRFTRSRVTWLTLRALRGAATAGRLLLQVLLALIIVFEEWGWRPLAAGLAKLARLKPIARVEAWIQRLPPYGALLVFGAPSIMILPLKLVALFLITSGREFEATLLFIGAKIVGTAIVARLFQLTETQLLQIPWFARAYGVFMPWKNALTAWVHDSWAWRSARAIKERVRVLMAPLVAAVRTEAASLMTRVRGWLGRT